MAKLTGEYTFTKLRNQAFFSSRTRKKSNYQPFWTDAPHQSWLNKFVHKIELNGNYSLISREIATDQRLEPEDRGLLMFVFSLSGQYFVTLNTLKRYSHCGDFKIKKILNRLQAWGYVEVLTNPKTGDRDLYFYDVPAKRPTLANSENHINKTAARYVQVPNEIARHKTLSLKARGMWLSAFCQPANTIFSDGFFLGKTSGGASSVKSGTAELKEAGLLRRARVKDARTGRVMYHRTHIANSPSVWNTVNIPAEVLFNPEPQANFILNKSPEVENSKLYNMLLPNFPKRKKKEVKQVQPPTLGNCAIADLLPVLKEKGIKNAVLKALEKFSQWFESMHGHLPPDLQALTTAENVKKLHFVCDHWDRLRNNPAEMFAQRLNQPLHKPAERLLRYLHGAAVNQSDKVRGEMWSESLRKVDSSHSRDVVELLRQWVSHDVQRTGLPEVLPDKKLFEICRDIEKILAGRKENHDFEYMLDCFMIHANPGGCNARHFFSFWAGLVKKISNDAAPEPFTPVCRKNGAVKFQPI